MAGSLCLAGTSSSAWAQTSAAPPETGKTLARRVVRPDARRPPGVRVPKPRSDANAAGWRATSIQGAAWRSDNTPLPKALLRLRNVDTGKIEATTVASDRGTFAFNGVPEGTYLIEMVSEAGKVITVGHTFTVAAGETVATFVRLGAKVSWFNGFFGNAAQTVSSSAASTGVTAIAPQRVQGVSPNQ